MVRLTPDVRRDEDAIAYAYPSDPDHLDTNRAKGDVNPEEKDVNVFDSFCPHPEFAADGTLPCRTTNAVSASQRGNDLPIRLVGRGYPPPNRTFRWCTQRLKIDPVNVFVKQRIGHWGEAVLHLGARREESATRAQTMADRESRNGLQRHRDLPRVWVSNPIQFLTTKEVWAYLLQKPNPWSGTNRDLYKLYASASNGECPVQIDTSTPSCGNSRFGCWTCTVVIQDIASEGLFASGDERMEPLLAFRQTLTEFRDPANGWRDNRRMNGNEGPGPLTIKGRRELLKRLLKLQEETGLALITPEELLLIQQMWKAARDPDDGRGVARIVNKQRGVMMNADLTELNRLREMEEKVAEEKGIRADTLRRLLAKVEEYSESHRAMGLPDDLLNILKDDLLVSSSTN